MQETETQNLDSANEAAEEIPSKPKVELRERELVEGEDLNLAPEPEREPTQESESQRSPFRTAAGVVCILMGLGLLFR